MIDLDTKYRFDLKKHIQNQENELESFVNPIDKVLYDHHGDVWGSTKTNFAMIIVVAIIILVVVIAVIIIAFKMKTILPKLITSVKAILPGFIPVANGNPIQIYKPTIPPLKIEECLVVDPTIVYVLLVALIIILTFLITLKVGPLMYTYLRRKTFKILTTSHTGASLLLLVWNSDHAVFVRLVPLFVNPFTKHSIGVKNPISIKCKKHFVGLSIQLDWAEQPLVINGKPMPTDFPEKIRLYFSGKFAVIDPLIKDNNRKVAFYILYKGICFPIETDVQSPPIPLMYPWCKLKERGSFEAHV